MRQGAAVAAGAVAQDQHRREVVCENRATAIVKEPWTSSSPTITAEIGASLSSRAAVPHTTANVPGPSQFENGDDQQPDHRPTALSP